MQEMIGPRKQTSGGTHNCTKEGHFSSNFPEPRFIYKQRELNKSRVEKFQAGMAPVAAAQKGAAGGVANQRHIRVRPGIV